MRGRKEKTKEKPNQKINLDMIYHKDAINVHVVGQFSKKKKKKSKVIYSSVDAYVLLIGNW